MLTPLEFVLPDAIAADIGRRIWLLENHPTQRVKVVFIELAVIESFGSLVNQRVEVNVFLEVKVVLPILWIERQKLAADCL